MPNLIKENIQKTSSSSSRSIKKLLRQRSFVVAFSLLLTGLGLQLQVYFLRLESILLILGDWHF